MSVRLRLAKEFYSIQGEGHLTGTPMYFIRTAGCSVTTCGLHPSNKGACDTDWQVRYESDVKEVAERALNQKTLWVCITGGEPTDQLKGVEALAGYLHDMGRMVMIQTSGDRKLSYFWDWVAVSPKSLETALIQCIGHELKWIWNGESEEQLNRFISRTKFQKYFLQPLLQPDGSSNIQDVAKMVMQCGWRSPWRLGIQQHKIWGGE